MVLAWAVLLGFLASLAGLPGAEFALDFIREAAGLVAVVQAKMLLLVGSIGALCFIVGRYRIEALVCYVADRLNADASKLAPHWSLMLKGALALVSLRTSPGLLVQVWCCSAGARSGFISGHTPKLE